MNDAKKCRVLAAARSVFLRYGYKRVSMNEIAEAAGVSRPALYVVFRNKEEIFLGVFLQWVDEACAEIEAGMAACASTQAKLACAFEIWAVRPFAMMLSSPEAKELIECSFDFAQNTLRQGYRKFEATIVPILASGFVTTSMQGRIGAQQIAHLLASAVRGFKQTASTQAELRLLIGELLALCLGIADPERGQG